MATVSIPPTNHNGGEQSSTFTEKSQISCYLREERLPCPYTSGICMKAAQIFAALRHERKLSEEDATSFKKRYSDTASTSQRPSPMFSDDNEKFLTYDLAFNTLDYQHIIEELMADVGLLAQHPDLLDVEPLAVVMLGDYQRRKFQPRVKGEDRATFEETLAVANAIESCSSRLNAALARRRIRISARSVEDMLPITSKARSVLGVSQPVHAWINSLKTSKREVVTLLLDDGYEQVTNYESLYGNSFLVDPSYDDVLAFSPDLKETIRVHKLVKCWYLILQDYTSCVGPRAVHGLICNSYDVVHVDAGNGTSTAHISSLMRDAGISGSILRFSTDDNDSSTADVQRLLQDLGATNVQLFREKLEDIEPADPRLKYAKAALLTPRCTRTAVLNPIDFLVSEGGDLTILKEFTQDKPNTVNDKARVGKNQSLLRLVMGVPSLKAVVYMTRSVNAVENEQVVSKVLDLVNANLPPKYAYRAVPHTGLSAGKVPQTDQVPHSGPLRDKVPLSGLLTDKVPQSSPDVYLRVAPSQRTNGCFVAVLSRETEDIPVKQSAKEKLARAAALLKLTDDIVTVDEENALAAVKRKVKGKRKSKTSKTKFAFGTTISHKKNKKKK